MRRLRFPGFVAAVLFAFAGGGQAQEVLRFGTSGQLSNESIAVTIAIEKGYFKEAGIAAEIVNFKGGAPAIQALVGKAIDLCICAPEHVIRLRNRNVDASVIVPLDNVTGYALFGPPNGAARDIKDLKGKKLGITSPGSKTDNLVRLAIRRAGLNPDTDFRILGVGGTANVLSSLQTGNIDAGMISGFDALAAERSGYSIAHDWRTRPVPNLGLLGLESWARRHPEQVRKLSAAVVKAARESVQDRALRVRTLKGLYPKAPPELIELGADRLVKSTVAQPRFAVDEFERLQRDVLELEPDLRPIAYDTFNPDFSR